MCCKQLIVHKGITERPLLQLRKSGNLFHKPLKQSPCQIKLAKAIKVLDRRYVTDQCLSVVAGPLQAWPILIQAQATLISLPSNFEPHRRENNT
jgi:hypothetical protein